MFLDQANAEVVGELPRTLARKEGETVHVAGKGVKVNSGVAALHFLSSNFSPREECRRRALLSLLPVLQFHRLRRYSLLMCVSYTLGGRLFRWVPRNFFLITIILISRTVEWHGNISLNSRHFRDLRCIELLHCPLKGVVTHEGSLY